MEQYRNVYRKSHNRRLLARPHLQKPCKDIETSTLMTCYWGILGISEKIYEGERNYCYLDMIRASRNSSTCARHGQWSVRIRTSVDQSETSIFSNRWYRGGRKISTRKDPSPPLVLSSSPHGPNPPPSL